MTEENSSPSCDDHVASNQLAAAPGSGASPRDTSAYVTYREFAERYAGMTFDGTERSSLWDRLVPKHELDLAAEGRRLAFRVIEDGVRYAD